MEKNINHDKNIRADHDNIGIRHGIDLSNLDNDVNPSENFYKYACGGWMKLNPLKPEFARFGTLDQLRNNNRIQVRELISGLDSRNAAPGSVAQKIGDLYSMGLDSLRLNIQGAQPVMGDVVAINQAGRADIIDMLATAPGMSGFFEIRRAHSAWATATIISRTPIAHAMCVRHMPDICAGLPSW